MKYGVVFTLGMFLFGIGGFFLATSVLSITGLAVMDSDEGSSFSLVVGIGIIIVAALMVIVARKRYGKKIK
jgi:hypothetical protein